MAEFYSARGWEIPPLPWTNLSPPFSTTNIYAEIDLEMKAKAMAICDIVEPGPIRPWKENKGLMAFLNSL